MKSLKQRKSLSTQISSFSSQNAPKIELLNKIVGQNNKIVEQNNLILNFLVTQDKVAPNKGVDNKKKRQEMEEKEDEEDEDNKGREEEWEQKDGENEDENEATAVENEDEKRGKQKLPTLRSRSSSVAARQALQKNKTLTKCATTTNVITTKRRKFVPKQPNAVPPLIRNSDGTYNMQIKLIEVGQCSFPSQISERYRIVYSILRRYRDYESPEGKSSYVVHEMTTSSPITMRGYCYARKTSKCPVILVFEYDTTRCAYKLLKTNNHNHPFDCTDSAAHNWDVTLDNEQESPIDITILGSKFSKHLVRQYQPDMETNSGGSDSMQQSEEIMPTKIEPIFQ